MMEEKTDTTKTTRSEIYAARLSPSEKSQIQQLAEELGMNGSQVIRLALRRAMPALLRAAKEVER